MLFVIMRELLDTSLTARSGFTLILFISVTSYMNVDAVSRLERVFCVCISIRSLVLQSGHRLVRQ